MMAADTSAAFSLGTANSQAAPSPSKLSSSTLVPQLENRDWSNATSENGQRH